jgi:hypothetical protein
VNDLDGVKTSLTSLIGRSFDHLTRNTYQPKEYNGYISSVLRNYQREKESTKGTIIMTEGVPHAGTTMKMMIIYSNASSDEA